MSLMTNCSRTGTKFDVDFHSLTPSRKAQLKKQKVPGREAYREVAQVTCQVVELARKSIRIRGGIPKPQVDQLKDESKIGEMLNGHRHIIKLVGTFWKEGHQFNILTYRVAVCDLGRFLDDCRVFRFTTEQRIEKLSDESLDDLLSLLAALRIAEDLFGRRRSAALGSHNAAIARFHGMYGTRNTVDAFSRNMSQST